MQHQETNMRYRRSVPEETQKRNPLTVRFDDEEHRLVCESAYAQRISCSELVRYIVISQLRSDDMHPEKTVNE